MVLGRSQGSVGSPDPLSGPLCVVLGRLGACAVSPGPSWVRSSVLCWRSWAALGAYVRGLGPHVAGLGPLLGRMFAVLSALGAPVGDPGLCGGPLELVLGRSWGI